MREFRLVLHTASVPHGDLFILDGGRLVTYEWPFEELPAERGRATIVQKPGGIRVVRKADHRLVYWTHEGEVSNNRGTVAELLRGFINIPHDFPETLELGVQLP